MSRVLQQIVGYPRAHPSSTPWGTPRTLVRQAPERVMVELGSLLVPLGLAE